MVFCSLGKTLIALMPRSPIMHYDRGVDGTLEPAATGPPPWNSRLLNAHSGSLLESLLLHTALLVMSGQGEEEER